MARGDYERLTAQAADQVWLRLQAGHATKPDGPRALAVHGHGARPTAALRREQAALAASFDGAPRGRSQRRDQEVPGSSRRPVCPGPRGPSLDVQSHGESADASAHNEAAPGREFRSRVVAGRGNP